MTAPLVVGLDLSLTATGIAYGEDHGHTITSNPSTGIGDDRLRVHAAAAAMYAKGAALAVIEDLPTHAHAAGITGMVHGAVRLTLLRLGIRYALVPPATLKKYATGKGNASKADMAVASFKRAQLEFRDDNQCDAWWLRAMGLDHLGHPIVTLPADQRAALLRVRWPKRLPHEEPLET